MLQTGLVAGFGAVLVMTGLAAHRPQRCFGLANRVTLLRGVVVCLLVGAMGAGRSEPLALAVTVAGAAVALLDSVDGWLARRLHTQSRYGARFDMETDALFVLVLSVLVVQLDKAGPWVLVSGLLRYAFVGAGLVVPRLGRPLAPSRRRKAVAALQMVLLVASLAPQLLRPASDVAAALAVLTLTISFAIDVRILWRA